MASWQPNQGNVPYCVPRAHNLVLTLRQAGKIFHENEGMDCITSISQLHLLTFNSYLNTLFLAIDANFRLKRRNVSSEASDPSFSNGWSYFVPEKGYKQYLQKYSDLIVQAVCCAAVFLVVYLVIF